MFLCQRDAELMRNSAGKQHPDYDDHAEYCDDVIEIEEIEDQECFPGFATPGSYDTMDAANFKKARLLLSS